MGDVQLSNCLSAEIGCSRSLRWVVLRGEVDLSAAAALRATLLGEGAPTVIVDLADVSFMDVVGAELLAGVHALLARRGGAIVLRRVGTQPGRVLDLLGLAHLLHAYAA